MSKQPIRITGEGITHRVEVDGRDISNTVTALTLEMDARTRLPVLTLTLLPGALDVETAAAIGVDDKTAEVLKALGWTPPEATP